ncbi:MAG: hypothetical protein QM655_00360 [Nocardioidaceae bacterium]
MSLMEKRLQLLLDQARYERVAAEASRSGRSVASVIREAIDLRFGDPEEQERSEAGRVLMAMIADNADTRPEPDWAEAKAAIEQELIDKLERAESS